VAIVMKRNLNASKNKNKIPQIPNLCAYFLLWLQLPSRY